MRSTATPGGTFPWRGSFSSVWKTSAWDADALLELGIGLAVDPGNYAIHRHIARELRERGDRDTARVVLEKGWDLHKKHVRRNDHESEKGKYFAILDAEPE